LDINPAARSGAMHATARDTLVLFGAQFLAEVILPPEGRKFLRFVIYPPDI
jgi:hypothetical protein